MAPPRGGYINYLKKPKRHTFVFDPLIDALAECRVQLALLQDACGVRTALYWESGQGIDVIDAIAGMLPPETNAQKRIIPPEPGMHST